MTTGVVFALEKRGHEQSFIYTKKTTALVLPQLVCNKKTTQIINVLKKRDHERSF